MRQLIVSEWVSLDGVFDASLMDQWFNPYHSDSRAQYIQETIRDCDAMLYGRLTYEMLYPYRSALKNNEMGVAEKLNKVRKYVVSSTLREGAWENSTVIRDPEVVARLKEEDGGPILVTGSASLVRLLLEYGLVDEMKLLMHPYIMGKGQRFFTEGMHAALTLTGAERLDRDVLLLTYRPG
jgi:dihydrofolate reductase